MFPWQLSEISFKLCLSTKIAKTEKNAYVCVYIYIYIYKLNKTKQKQKKNVEHITKLLKLKIK